MAAGQPPAVSMRVAQGTLEVTQAVDGRRAGAGRSKRGPADAVLKLRSRLCRAALLQQLCSTWYLQQECRAADLLLCKAGRVSAVQECQQGQVCSASGVAEAAACALVGTQHNLAGVSPADATDYSNVHPGSGGDRVAEGSNLEVGSDQDVAEVPYGQLKQRLAPQYCSAWAALRGAPSECLFSRWLEKPAALALFRASDDCAHTHKLAQA